MVEIVTTLKGCSNKGNNVTEVPTRDSISSANPRHFVGSEFLDALTVGRSVFVDVIFIVRKPDFVENQTP